MKTIIYGCGSKGRAIYEELASSDVVVLAFSDSNPQYWETTLSGLDIIKPQDIENYDYDSIIIASYMSYEIIAEKLIREHGIDKAKIDVSYVERSTQSRETFITSFAQIVYKKGMPGNIAEGGVCEGLFAAKMNALFPERTLYLFDTFKGFDNRDVVKEHENGFSDFSGGHLNFGSEEMVLSRLPFPEKAVIKKGYFPETAQGISDQFVFVNLDFDLYNPTLAGLQFFWDKMVHGGIILVHDYFSPGYRGISAAVDEFTASINVPFFPIGDHLSAALLKT